MSIIVYIHTGTEGLLTKHETFLKIITCVNTTFINLHIICFLYPIKKSKSIIYQLR